MGWSRSPSATVRAGPEGEPAPPAKVRGRSPDGRSIERLPLPGTCQLTLAEDVRNVDRLPEQGLGPQLPEPPQSRGVIGPRHHGHASLQVVLAHLAEDHLAAPVGEGEIED